MKPGWHTSELTVAGLTGATIYEIAGAPVASMPEALVRAAACLALAWIAGRYASARTEAKGRAAASSAKTDLGSRESAR